MAQRGGAVHVVTTERTYKGRVYRTHVVRRGLRGEKFVPANERLEIIASTPHGDVDAVLRAMRRLDFSSLLSSRPCREVDLVVGMVVAPRYQAGDDALVA